MLIPLLCSMNLLLFTFCGLIALMMYIIEMVNELNSFLLELREIIVQHPLSYARILKSPRNKRLLDAVDRNALEDMSLNEKLFLALSDLHFSLKCKTCGKSLAGKKCHLLRGYAS